jgi:hypothetical protein
VKNYEGKERWSGELKAEKVRVVLPRDVKGLMSRIASQAAERGAVVAEVMAERL